MFKAMKSAYGAGYRSGLADGEFEHCPYTGFFKVMAWQQGWLEGFKNKMGIWLEKKKAGF